MVLLHGETAGLHLAEADPRQGIPKALFVQRGNGCCDREAEAFAGTEIEQHGCSQQTDAEQPPESCDQQKRQPQHQQICPCQLLFSRQQRQRRKHLHLLLKSPWKKVRTESS